MSACLSISLLKNRFRRNPNHRKLFRFKPEEFPPLLIFGYANSPLMSGHPKTSISPLLAYQIQIYLDLLFNQLSPFALYLE